MSSVNTGLRTGSIHSGDDFDSVAEVAHLFESTATRLRFHNYFTILGRPDEITCLLTEKGGDRWHNVPEYGPNQDEKGWNEILTYDEYNDDVAKSEQRVKDELAHPRQDFALGYVEALPGGGTLDDTFVAISTEETEV